MSGPQLSRALILEARDSASDGAGGFTEVWSVLGTLWAEVTARTGAGTGRAGAAVSRANYRIVVRGAPVGSAARPTAGQRLRDDARTFAILAVTEADAGGRYLTCWAEEELAP
jgi:SPP1 family predicted phage head-tail adaptor